MEKNEDKIIKRAEELQYELEGLNEIQQKYYIYQKISELGLDSDFEKRQEEAGKDWSKTNEVLAWYKISEETTRLFAPITILALKENQVRNKKSYQEAWGSFQKVLENYKMLAEDLKLDTALEKYHLFTYLLWNGYFSKTKEHSYDKNHRKNIFGLYALDLVRGNGVCLNYADGLKKYLQTCGAESELLLCKIPTQKGKICFRYRPDIERKVKRGSFIKTLLLAPLAPLITSKMGNHAITLIKEKDKYLAYDPTNLAVLNIKDDKKASLVTGSGNFDLKLTASFMMGDSNGALFAQMLEKPIVPALEAKETIFNFENTLETIKENKSLLDDAYINIHGELEFIDKELSQKKKQEKKLEKRK